MLRSSRVPASSGQRILWPALLCLLGLPGVVEAADSKPAAATKSAPAGKPVSKKSAPVGMTAAQMIERNVVARGGLQAWRTIQSMSVTGKLDAGAGDSIERSDRIARGGLGASAMRAMPEAPAGAPKATGPQQIQLPFTLELKRPNKSRLEIVFAGKTALQVYDGKNGWKVRPFLNRDEVEPFTTDEAKSEARKGGMEGPLIDYAAKGTKVEFVAVEPVEGHDAYKLKLTLSNGDVQYVWLDTQNFLDVKVQGIPRRMDGQMRDVWVYQRDFRTVQGVLIPFVYETAIDAGRETHKMIFETVALNRVLSDARFSKPELTQPARAPQSQAAPPASH